MFINILFNYQGELLQRTDTGQGEFPDYIFVSIPYIGLVFTSHENRWRHFTVNKSYQIIESILKYKNGFKNNLMYKEIFS
jgi:hypothetical protein